MATTVNSTCSSFYRLYGTNSYSSLRISTNTTAYVGYYNNRYRAAFQFNNLSLPAGAIITDVKLTFYVRSLSNAPADNFYIATTEKNLSSLSNADLITTITDIESASYKYKQNSSTLMNALTANATHTETLDGSIFKNVYNTPFYIVIGGVNTYTSNKYFRSDASPAPTLSITYIQGTMFYRINNQWQECLVHYYDGSKWVQVMPKYYDGSKWVQVR